MIDIRNFIMLSLISCLFFPAPRINESITEDDLVGDYDFVWGSLDQDLHFNLDIGIGWSRFGAGPWAVDSVRNLVDFQEGEHRYRMELKKCSTGFVGVGYSTACPDHRVEVRLTRRY